MPIPPQEAARALRDAEAAADRSTAAVGYQRASQHLFLWGAVWAAVNLAAYFRLPLGGYAFAAFMLFGIVGSVIIGVKASRGGGRRNYAGRGLVVISALVLFSFGVQAVMPQVTLVTAESIICLAIGAAYMVMGVSMGWRLSAVGAALMLVVIGGSLYAREQMFLWMALAGGGGLIFGGLWLRKA